ncbi:hypothetical protein [Moorena sp. SIO3H5]|uniref:hypothetical protein n=1 Tax=Moorena sp. SIO3H5 TaxID=2607834 RepID=UPI0013B732A7|nr:hypothetical protein [Moorena sp. SIO3H5]NEO71589.1 hypothetical protein [Moorena sp. SIO3H5]
MSKIKISELHAAGSELFHDSESFLNELTDEQEIDSVLGGFHIPFSKRTIPFSKTFPIKTFPIKTFPIKTFPIKTFPIIRTRIPRKVH